MGSYVAASFSEQHLSVCASVYKLCRELVPAPYLKDKFLVQGCAPLSVVTCRQMTSAGVVLHFPPPIIQAYRFPLSLLALGSVVLAREWCKLVSLFE